MDMKDEDFSMLMESVKEAGSIMRGETQPSRRIEISSLDIKAIREKTRKSQGDFALMIGVSLGTLRNWEQGRRKPEGPARALLKVVSQNPEYVEKVLTH
jgi:putative transcriptional regulator